MALFSGLVRQTQGNPTRLQQLRKLISIYGRSNVAGRVLLNLGRTTTKTAKGFEQVLLKCHYLNAGLVFPGNIKSFIP
jgi:hypothetical protein